MIIRCIECMECLDGDIEFGYINTDDIVQYRMINSHGRWVLQGRSRSLESWIDICDYTDVDKVEASVIFKNAMQNIINGVDPHDAEFKSGKSKSKEE